MSNTPETDAAYKYWPSENAELVDADFARLLERKRDEARKSEIAAIAEREKWRMQAEQKWAMRRELEEILEVTEGAACDEQFAKGIEALRQLKRERDEARDAIRALAEHGEYEIQRITKERDEARVKMADALQDVDLRTLDFERMKQERDEAIADRDIARLAALDRDKAHDRMVGELEKVYDERDEAREDLDEEKKFHHRTHAELIQTQCKLLDMQMGRDEAREEINRYRDKLDLLPISWDV